MKHENMFVVDYTAMFEGLSRFSTYINVEDAMISKCEKFEARDLSNVEIWDYDTLVHKCRMFYDAGKAKVNHYKAMNDNKGKGHGFGKWYNKDKGKKKDVGGVSKPNVSDVRCYKSFECKGKEIVCYESNFWNMFKNTNFSETRFSQRKMIGLGLFTVTLIYKRVLDGNHEL